MAKVLLTFKGKCFNVGKTHRGTSLQFARNVEKTDKGPAAREVVVFNVLDKDVANALEVVDSNMKGKEYTITITESDK
jgi:hypothetical protein